MQRFFMRRASAVIFLLDRRRGWFGKIEVTPSGDVELEVREIESIDRLILDVRAGRVYSFQLTHPRDLEVFVSD